jgi:HSP20 family protein
MAGTSQSAKTAFGTRQVLKVFLSAMAAPAVLSARDRGVFFCCGQLRVAQFLNERRTIMSTAMTTSGSRQMQPLFRPFASFRREFDELFGRLASDWDPKWLTSEFKAACDVSETADAYQIHMDVPGMKPEEINVQVTGETVHISGERKEEKEEKGRTRHRVERRTGTFSETIVLPAAVNDEKVQAEFKDGVLTVTLPKSAASKTRTVKVKANGT